jgi:hypothetical protein
VTHRTISFYEDLHLYLFGIINSSELTQFILGSAGFATDLTFNGGLIGAQVGNQQVRKI